MLARFVKYLFGTAEMLPTVPVERLALVVTDRELRKHARHWSCNPFNERNLTFADKKFRYNHYC